jgi:hypothetical protein
MPIHEFLDIIEECGERKFLRLYFDVDYRNFDRKFFLCSILFEELLFK